MQKLCWYCCGDGTCSNSKASTRVSIYSGLFSNLASAMAISSTTFNSQLISSWDYLASHALIYSSLTTCCYSRSTLSSSTCGSAVSSRAGKGIA